MNKTDISSFNLDELAEYLADLSEKTGVKIEKYRAKQIYSFLVKGAADFDELSNKEIAYVGKLKEYHLQ